MSWRDELIGICGTAGEMFAERSHLDVRAKQGHANFVTDIDTRVQSYLNDALTKLMPNSRFLGEEGESEPLTDALTWIVDPVDGTTNLIHDYRASAVSVALCEGKQPIAGAIRQPYARETFFAESGRGAYLNGDKIRVSQFPLANALTAFGTSPYNAELSQKSLNTALSYLRASADIRRSGSAALDLASLACGRVDVFFEYYLKPWDFAAGGLIVKEAGGIFTMPLSPNGIQWGEPNAIFAATPTCFDEAYEIFLAAGC